MDASNVAGLGQQSVTVSAATTTDVPPGRGVLSLTAAAPVTITALRAVKSIGRLIVLECAIGSSPITLTHKDVSAAATNDMVIAQRQNLVLNPGDAVLFRQNKNLAWVQVAQASPVFIKSTSGGTSRAIAHGLSSTPKVFAITVTTSAGALGSGWTLGAIDGTNVNITVANASDIVYLILVP